MNNSPTTPDAEWEPPTPAETLERHRTQPKTLHEGNPFPDADPVAVAENYTAIMVKHLRLTLRDDTNQTIAEGGDIANTNVNSLISQLQAMGYDANETWLIRSLAKNLPRWSS